MALLRFQISRIAVAALTIVNFGMFAPAHGQPSCKQLDELEQTRCQIANAMANKNLGLLQRIFERSIYADVNDRVACMGKGYMYCAVGSGDIRIAKFLFAQGYDAAQLIGGRYPQLSSFVIDHGLGTHDEFVVALFDLYLENLADLLEPNQASNVWALPNPTTLSFLMMKCFQPHNQYPRYNRMIRIVVERDTSPVTPIGYQSGRYKNDVLKYLAMSVEKSRKPADVDNCSELLDWARAQYSPRN